MTDGGHGRAEVRRCRAVSSVEWPDGREEWKNLKTIVMPERERHTDDVVSTETAFYISSLPGDASVIGNAVRSHRGVENCHHRVPDVAFREDDSRMRKGNSAENFAVLRHITLNFIKKEASGKGSIKTKRLRAGWDNEYLARILAV